MHVHPDIRVAITIHNQIVVISFPCNSVCTPVVMRRLYKVSLDLAAMRF